MTGTDVEAVLFGAAAYLTLVRPPRLGLAGRGVHWTETGGRLFLASVPHPLRAAVPPMYVRASAKCGGRLLSGRTTWPRWVIRSPASARPGVAAIQRMLISLQGTYRYAYAMDLTDVMRSAGATREFRSDAVPGEALYRVLDNARFAPSGGNRQGWRVIIVRDPGLRSALRDLYLRSWRQNMQPLFTHLPDNGSRPADRYAEHLDQLPVQLVVLVERAARVTTVAALDNSGFVPGASIYPFVQNIVLGLRAEGLGTTLTAGLTPVEAEAKKLLEIPDGFSIAAHLGIGWPAGHLPTRLKRRPVENFATLDRFGGESLLAAPSA